MSLGARRAAAYRDPMDENLIISPAADPARFEVRQSRLQNASRFMMRIGAVMTAVSLLALIGFALYPLFSGQGLREFFVSLIVPVLISLMGIVPGLLLWGTGRQVLRHGAGYGPAAIAMILSLPPLAFGAALLPRLGVTNAPARAACIVIGAGLLIWAISIFTARVKTRA